MGISWSARAFLLEKAKKTGQVDGKTYLSEFADVSNPLPLEGLEIGGDPAVLQVHDSSERLIKERADRQHGEVAGFRL